MPITWYEPELLINLIWKLGYAPGYALPQPNLDHVNVVILFYFKYSMWCVEIIQLNVCFSPHFVYILC